MTAKEYLNQARHLDALINCRLREIDYWRDLSSSVSGSNFEPHYNPNKPTEAPFARCLEKIDAIQKDVAEKVAYLVCLKETINAAIDRLASREEQLVLRYRYLDNCSSKFFCSGLKVGTVWHSMAHLTYGMITIAK